MKQKIMKRVVCCFLMLCCFLVNIESSKIEVQSATSLSSMVKQIKEKNYKKAAQIAKKLPQKANEKCVKKMSAKMKKAYRKKVLYYYNTKNKYMNSYFLTDIDKDEKAELLIECGRGAADSRVYIFKYSNSKLRKIGTFYCSHGTFHKYSNGILMSQCHMDYETITQIYFKNGRMKEKIIAEHKLNYAKNESYLDLPYCLYHHQIHSKDFRSLKFDLKDLK